MAKVSGLVGPSNSLNSSVHADHCSANSIAIFLAGSRVAYQPERLSPNCPARSSSRWHTGRKLAINNRIVYHVNVLAVALKVKVVRDHRKSPTKVKVRTRNNFILLWCWYWCWF